MKTIWSQHTNNAVTQHLLPHARQTRQRQYPVIEGSTMLQVGKVKDVARRRSYFVLKLCSIVRSITMQDVRVKEQYIVQRKSKKKKKTEITKVPPSMSMLCAISEDGFFLDIFLKSHKVSYFKDKGSKENPIHFSASERIHVPQ
eukprot:scaffold421414_cov96-Attheya_sp.AAC.1